MQEQRLRQMSESGGQRYRTGNHTQFTGCTRTRETRKGKNPRALKAAGSPGLKICADKYENIMTCLCGTSYILLLSRENNFQYFQQDCRVIIIKF